MKKYSRLSLLLAAATFAACSSEENEPMVPNTPDTPTTPTEGYHFTFDGGVGTATATRASWNDDKGSGNLIFQWDYTPEETVGDEVVMVFVSDTLLASTAGKHHTYANVNPHSQHAGDAHWATFETVETYEHKLSSGQYDGYKVMAVTPLCTDNRSSVSSSANSFSATLPMPDTFTQAAKQKPEFLSDYMYMYATDTIAGGSASLEFKHIPATFRFIITNKRPAETTTIKNVRVSLADAAQPIASKSATIDNKGNLAFSQETHTAITTLLGENGTAVQKDSVYTAYALVLPLGDENGVCNNAAFSGQKIQFTIGAGNPANEYLSYVLDADKLAGVNPKSEYNWVGGKSYTIRMSLSDVLIFEGITVDDWNDGGSMGSGESVEWVNGINTETGEYEPARLNADSHYELGNAGNLLWFAQKVNAGSADIGAVLTNDIDLTGQEWTPIGNATNKFSGTFDGAGHSISGLSMTVTDAGDYGLVGYVSGATVKDFSISGSITTDIATDKGAYNFGVIGYVNGDLTVEGVRSSLHFTSNDGIMKNTVGGIVGSVGSGSVSISRCTYDGTINLGTASVDCLGGIAGYIYAGRTASITDCGYYGTVTSQQGGQMGGMLGYYRLSNLTVKNCLSVGTITTADATTCGAIVGILRQHGSANTKVTNNYYLTGNPFGNSNQTDDITDGFGSQTAAGSATAIGEQSATDLTTALGSNWELPEGGTYPKPKMNE